jgi:phosphoadenosine phosphosulfate reductase
VADQALSRGRSPGRSERLRGLVDRARRELRDADAETVLRWADEQLDGRIVVATSLQDAVVVSLASRVHPGVDVVFLETGYHFIETLGLRDAVAAQYDVRLLSVQPGLSVAEQDAEHGKDLFATNPNLCCHLRKVVPLDTMLGMYDGWVTGLRRADSPERSAVETVEWDAKRELVKLNPIAHWSDEDVDRYVADEGVLLNPLLTEGYPSVGCRPCTACVAPGDDLRAGRWAGSTKTECGLHEQ